MVVFVCRQHTVLVNRGWVPPNWKAEWQQHFMKQQPQGLVSVSGVVQGSESPSSYVPQNQPGQGMFYWMDVQGLVSDGSTKNLGQACCAALIPMIY
jgi:cytochrome oxidase assembly protein ShyY1